jgi:hypothetical protein
LVESLSLGPQLINRELSPLTNEDGLDRSNCFVQFQNWRPNHGRGRAIDLRTDPTDPLEDRIALGILTIAFQPTCLSEHYASIRRVSTELTKTDVSVEIDIDVDDTVLPSLELVVLVVSQDHGSLANLREREGRSERQGEARKRE